MKKLIKLFLLILVITYFASYKNLTINVIKTKEIKINNTIIREVYTSDNKTYYVPYDDSLGWNMFKNLILLNFDANEDWNTLQKPGKYYIRVYGFRTFYSNNKLNVIKILESPDEKPTFIILYEFAKESITIILLGIKKALEHTFAGVA